MNRITHEFHKQQEKVTEWEREVNNHLPFLFPSLVMMLMSMLSALFVGRDGAQVLWKPSRTGDLQFDHNQATF